MLFYLSSARAWNQPPFAFAILKSYCDLKLARGKMLNDLDQKLSIVESQVSMNSMYCVGRGRSEAMRTAANTPWTPLSPSCRRRADASSLSPTLNPSCPRFASTMVCL